MELPDLEQLLGVKSIFVKAGLAGAIVGAVVQKVPDWREALARGVAGVGCAAYLTPMPVRWLGVTDTSDIGALAFCMGLGGMGLATAIIALLRDPMRLYRMWRNLPDPTSADRPGDRP